MRDGSLEVLSESGLHSEPGFPFESYKCCILDKRKLIFNLTKGDFSRADLGILRTVSHQDWCLYIWHAQLTSFQDPSSWRRPQAPLL